MFTHLLHRLLAAGRAAAQALRRLLVATRPAAAPLVTGTLADLVRTKPELLVQPDTLLRWHRRLFRWSWRRTSRSTASAHRPPLAPETVALIREMAAGNRLWGAERIRGELYWFPTSWLSGSFGDQGSMIGSRPPKVARKHPYRAVGVDFRCPHPTFCGNSGRITKRAGEPSS